MLIHEDPINGKGIHVDLKVYSIWIMIFHKINGKGITC